MSKKSRLERAVEATQVCAFMANRGEYLTSHQLAFWVGLQPSTHFNQVLLFAVERGWLKMVWMPHRPNIRKRGFAVTEKGQLTANAHFQHALFNEDKFGEF